MTGVQETPLPRKLVGKGKQRQREVDRGAGRLQMEGFLFSRLGRGGVGNLEEVCLLKKRNEWVETEKLKV